MKTTVKAIFFTLTSALLMTSCISKSEFEALQAELDNTKSDLTQNNIDLKEQVRLLGVCEQDLSSANTTIGSKDEQINDLRDQIVDLRKLRDRTVEQVGDLTTLTQSANDNIRETLSQLEGKDKYIQHIQAAKTKADSLNLALAVNLTNVLEDGIDDSDIEISVDKTVVYINLSDKMLFKSGSSDITPRANEVLGKIAQIVESRPEVEVMVEGHTDNLPISRTCYDDNWDLSVLRSTSVVRVLQDEFGIASNRLIAAGRGEHVPLVTNDTSQGRSANRRTRIIILPKVDQFYDLLSPSDILD
ncbi:MAG: OmpA family protein [Saprospiraceae bacterium]|nr:OmpA family protein [Saprospiraceae bacterium]|tara:strand:+ start:8480 stop:9385 length:906 start_codon:yes stop_codon:yes gene_type:complete